MTAAELDALEALRKQAMPPFLGNAKNGDRGKYLDALESAAPRLIEAARQNERRGWLLKRVGENGIITDDDDSRQLADDIAKELP